MQPMKYDFKRCKAQLAIIGKRQSQVAEAAGISRQVASKFFSGQTVTTGNAKAIIESIGLKVVDVLIDKSIHSSRGNSSNWRRNEKRPRP
jgi:hypothetical protein